MASIFSSQADIQLTLVVSNKTYKQVINSSKFNPSKNQEWVLEIDSDENENSQVWFLISKAKTSGELAHFAQTSNIQTTNR